jgi:hypothetical protein
MNVRYLTVVFLSLYAMTMPAPLWGENCITRLEGERCDANGGSSPFCSLLFPSYHDECAVELSYQHKVLSTWWHQPVQTQPTEFGHTGVQQEPPNVQTVCEQARNCIFTPGNENEPDSCLPPADPDVGWYSYLTHTAYSWTGTCQSPGYDD